MPYRRRYRRRTRRPLRKTVYRRRAFRKRKFAKAVRRIATNISETKHLSAIGSANVLMNRMTILNLVGIMPQGTSQTGIIGEQVFIKGFRLRFTISNFPGDAANIAITRSAHSQVKFWLVWSRREYTTNVFVGALRNQLLVDAANSILLDRVNTDEVKLLASKTVRFTPQFSGQTIDKTMSMYFPINKNFRFQSAASGNTSAYGKYGTYFLFYSFWAPGATENTTFLGVTTHTTMYWKDP